jgi:hypothetical protein
MRQYNPILDHFEAPVSMGDIINCTVAYLDKVTWKDKNRVIYFGMQLIYAENVGCTHCAPMNEQTNWGGRSTDNEGKPLPTGYPGWEGRLWLGTFKGAPITSPRNKHIDEILRRIGIHTGAGGGGTYSIPPAIQEKIGWNTIGDSFNCWGYAVKLFEQDWISMALARTLNPNGIWIKNAFNDERPMLYYYVNSPWDITIMPRSQHKAKWAVSDVEVPNLKFA